MSYPGQNPEERQDTTHSNQSGPQTSNSNNQNQGQAQGQGQRDRYLFHYLFYDSDTYYIFTNYNIAHGQFFFPILQLLT